MSDSDRRVEALSNEIDEAVAVGRMDLQQRMATSELGKYGCDKHRPTRQGSSDTKKPAKGSLRRHRLLCRLKLANDAGGMFAESDAGLGQRCTASRAREQLIAERLFEPR